MAVQGLSGSDPDRPQTPVPGPADPDTGGSYTVKVYESDKTEVKSEVQSTVALTPVNPDY